MRAANEGAGPFNVLSEATISTLTVGAQQEVAVAHPFARRDNGLLFQGVQELPAGLLAAPAGLGADLAVRHVGMPLALVTAALADRHAGLQQRLGDIGVVAAGRLVTPAAAVQTSAQSGKAGCI